MPKLATTDNPPLFCERCGYVLEGFGQDEVCPECARPVSENQPATRIGTLAQQSAKLRASYKTIWMTFVHPREMYLRMSFMGEHAKSPGVDFIWASVLLCWILMVLTMAIHLPPILVLLGFTCIMGFIGCVITTCMYLLNLLMSGVIFLVADLAEIDRPYRFAFIAGGHASAAWLLTGLIWVGGYVAADIYRLRMDPQTDYEFRVVTGNQIQMFYEPAFLIGLLVGALMFVFLMCSGYYHTRYINMDAYKANAP